MHCSLSQKVSKFALGNEFEQCKFRLQLCRQSADGLTALRITKLPILAPKTPKILIIFGVLTNKIVLEAQLKIPFPKISAKLVF